MNLEIQNRKELRHEKTEQNVNKWKRTRKNGKEYVKIEKNIGICKRTWEYGKENVKIKRTLEYGKEHGNMEKSM